MYVQERVHYMAMTATRTSNSLDEHRAKHRLRRSTHCPQVLTSKVHSPSKVLPRSSQQSPSGTSVPTLLLPSNLYKQAVTSNFGAGMRVASESNNKATITKVDPKPCFDGFSDKLYQVQLYSSVYILEISSSVGSRGYSLLGTAD